MVRPSSYLLASCVIATILLVVPSAAYPSPSYYNHDDGPYEPEEIMSMLNRLRNLIEMERKMENYNDEVLTSQKRALDLGLGRGYSGALQAKHLIGLAAANYADGPGRRRRAAAQ